MDTGLPPSRHPKGTARLHAEVGAASGETLPAPQRSITPSCHPGTSLTAKKMPSAPAMRCAFELWRGVILLRAPTTGLEMVQEPKHRPLLFLGTLPRLQHPHSPHELAWL